MLRSLRRCFWGKINEVKMYPVLGYLRKPLSIVFLMFKQLRIWNGFDYNKNELLFANIKDHNSGKADAPTRRSLAEGQHY